MKGASGSFLRILLALCVLAEIAGAAVVTLTPVQDATLYQDGPGAQSSGASAFLMAGSVGGKDATPLRRALLQFNFSSLPAGAVINSVQLTMNLTKVKNNNAAATTLQRVTAAWVEGTTNAGTGGNGALANPGDATWLHRSSPQAWTNPGGDFLGINSANLNVGGTGLYTWSGAGLVHDVQNWLAAPSQNFGWILRGNETTPQSIKEFSSRSGATPPSLKIDYTVVPEPSLPGAMGLILLFPCRSRRHV